MPWIYDPKLRGSGYRNTDTGRALSNVQARELIDNAISSGGDVGDSLATLYAGGQISPSDWKERMRQEIKDQYITQYLQGIGGRNNMGPADWGSVGGMIAEQYGWLDGFTNDLDNLTEVQIAHRASMYMNSSREAYERAYARAASGKGYTEHAWGLGDTEHCDDCIYLANLGFILIEDAFIAPSTGSEAIPGSGNTICLTKCGCGIQYR